MRFGNSVRLFSIALCLLLLLSITVSCIKIVLEPEQPQRKPNMIEWKYDKLITEPINATSGTETVSLGDIQSQKVKVIVFGESFDTPTRLSLVTPQSVPAIDSNEFMPIGSPIDISAETKQRLNLPATIFMKIDDMGKYGVDLKKGNIWIAYYNGTDWDYCKPGIDFNKGQVIFSTYHFSFFGWGKIDQEERIEKYIHSKTLAETLQEDVIDAAVNNAAAGIAEDILRKQFGIKDDAQVAKVITALVKNDEIKEAADKLSKGDAEGFYQDLSASIGNTIAEAVDESVLSTALKKIADPDIAAAIGRAPGYLAAGDYLGAGRIIGETIANQFMFTKIAMGAVEITQYSIDYWKKEELEAAYQVFMNGANGYWSYKVGAKDFDDLWLHMKGLSRQLELEARQNEIARRTSMNMPVDTKAAKEQIEAVVNRVRENVKKQFEERAKKETEIKQEEARLAKLVKAYQDSHLITNLEFGYEDIMPVENRIDSLLRIRAKILRDTGRKGWNFGTVSTEQEIALGDLLTLTQAWFSDATGKKYAAELKRIFGIDLNKKKTTTKCDLVIEPKALKGEVNTPYTFTAKVGSPPDKARYDWVVQGRQVQSGANNTIKGNFKSEGSYTISVTMYDSGQELCTASATAIIKATQQAKPPAPQPPAPQPPAPSGTGWYREGAPVITPKVETYTNPNCYFGVTFTPGDSSCQGSVSWKEAGCTRSSGGCSGTYTSTTSWTPPPSFLKPGDKYLPKFNAQTTANNTCGGLNFGSWVSLYGDGKYVGECNDGSRPCSNPERQNISYTVPDGKPGQKLAIEASCHTPGGAGYVTYNYVYK